MDDPTITTATRPTVTARDTIEGVLTDLGRLHAELPAMSQARAEVAGRTLGRLAEELAEAASMLGGGGA
jgi:hypothetical protein